jgi:hypothetical protein
MEKCITNCTPKNTKYYHPNTLTQILNDFDSCAIITKNPSDTNDKSSRKCIINKEVNIQGLIPYFFIDTASFLGLYDIKDFNDMFVWINKNDEHILNFILRTQVRVVNESFKLLDGEDIDKLLDPRFIDFCIKFFNDNIQEIYEKLKGKNVKDPENISFVDKEHISDYLVSERKEIKKDLENKTLLMKNILDHFTEFISKKI